MTPNFCPACKKAIFGNDTISCSLCGSSYALIENVWHDSKLDDDKDKKYYDQLYDTQKGDHWLKGLNNQSFVKAILEKISLSYRRERFFKKYLKGNNNKILDLACGAGRDYLKKYGDVTGVDVSLASLIYAKEKYDSVVLTSAFKLPFADNSFDYVISSDFFGHVLNEDKDKIIQEIFRVLKPGGMSLNIIETDSTNYFIQFAHQTPELFKKYFIEQIGGHIGLEMPSQVVRRWQDNNFKIIQAEKIWGSIWPIGDYKSLFDNEYKKLSKNIAVLVSISKIFSSNKIVASLVNILLNPINYFLEKVTKIDHGQGLMIAVKK